MAERLVPLDSTYRPARAILGEIQLELGAYDEARRTFGMLVTSRGDLGVAPRFARWEELRGRPAEARRLLRDGARRGVPAARHARRAASRGSIWRLGDLALRQGRLDEAERELEAGLAVVPDDHRLLGGLARRPPRGARLARGHRRTASAPSRGTWTRPRWVCCTRPMPPRATAPKPRSTTTRMSVSGAAASRITFHRAWGLLLLDHGREVPGCSRAPSGRSRPAGRLWLGPAGLGALPLGPAAEAREKMRLALALGTRDASLFYHAGMIEAALGRHGGRAPLPRDRARDQPAVASLPARRGERVLAALAGGED